MGQCHAAAQPMHGRRRWIQVTDMLLDSLPFQKVLDIRGGLDITKRNAISSKHTCPAVQVVYEMLAIRTHFCQG